tara:strand:+ start:14555 stop:14878 length:324 start_codon:yes stop_codon:yes gene_type:complete
MSQITYTVSGSNTESSKHSGSKYERKIAHLHNPAHVITVDVYSVLEAFKVTCPARQHAIKKLLCSGLRGKGSVEQDLKECLDAIIRGLELQKVRELEEQKGMAKDAK